MKAKVSPEAARSAMRLGTAEGAFATASENAGGPFLALYALHFGASRAQIGLLTSLPALISTLLQMPAASLTERLGRRKSIIVAGALGARFIWLPLALIPFFFGGQAAIAALLVLVTLRAIVGSPVGSAWTSVMADVVPRRVRGMYFANRNIVSTLSGLAASLLAGWLIRAGDFPLGYQIALLVAFITGMVTIGYLWRLPDPPMAQAMPKGAQAGSQAGTGAGAGGGLGEAVRLLGRMVGEQRTFRGYVLSGMLWNFAVWLPAPLFSVYFVTGLGGSEAAWGIVTAANLLTTVVGQRYWGQLTNRFGEKTIMLLGGMGAASLPLLWAATPVAGGAVVINLIGGFVWAGYNLAAFNLLLRLTPEARRTTYIALFNTAVGLAQATAPYIGGLIADAFSIRTVFFISATLRFTGWLVFNRQVALPAPRRLHLADLLPRTARLVARGQRVALPPNMRWGIIKTKLADTVARRRRVGGRVRRAPPGQRSAGSSGKPGTR